MLNTDKTQAPGKIGTDGKYLYATSSVNKTQSSYDGTQEELSTVNGGSDPTTQEPDVVIPPSMSEGEQAVFFENTANWGGKINAYLWNGSIQYAGSWPGERCTYLGNNIWKWQYSGTDKISGGLIFNNGSSQTADFTYINGGYYNHNGYVKTINGAGDIPDTPNQPNDDTYTWTFYYADTNWPSNVHTYVWDAGNNNKQYLGSWPGKTMTYNSTLGMWEYTFTTNDQLMHPMVIFHNNAGHQTADLELINYGVYKFSGIYDTITSVENTYLEPVEPEYYTLQGIRVPADRLTPGIYICRKGTKVTKIMVK